jgi:hypothetical protein
MRYSESQLLITQTLQRVFLNFSIIQTVLPDKGTPIEATQKQHILNLLHLCLRKQRTHNECLANIHIEAQVRRCMDYVLLLKKNTLESDNLRFYDEVAQLLQQLRY